MGSTDTISQERDRAIRESNSNPAEEGRVPSRRSALGWIAVALACLGVVVLGLFALAGSSGDETEVPSWEESVEAEASEREARFDGQERTYGGAQNPARGSGLPPWRDRVEAEAIERQARLDGQERTYGG